MDAGYKKQRDGWYYNGRGTWVKIYNGLKYHIHREYDSPTNWEGYPVNIRFVLRIVKQGILGEFKTATEAKAAAQQHMEMKMTAVGRMSNDRVKFVLTDKMLTGLDWESYHDLLEKAFKISRSELDKAIQEGSNMTVLCRPSQFARFLIWRNEMGVSNSFKELSPELIPGKQPSKVVEVWDRPA